MDQGFRPTRSFHMLNATSRPCLVLALVAALLAAGCERDSADTAQPRPSSTTAPARSGGASAGPVIAEGNFEAADCTQVAGWAWDPKQPDAPLTVEVFDGAKLLGTARADVFRQDLLNAKRGNGRHGFLYPVPASVKDGKPHSIRVRVVGAVADLPNSPKTITCSPGERE